MTAPHFATIGIRVLGVATIVVGLIFASSGGIMRAMDASSTEQVSKSDLHLRDTYHVVSHFEQTWFILGAVSLASGILLLLTSRRLGVWLARGIETER